MNRFCHAQYLQFCFPCPFLPLGCPLLLQVLYRKWGDTMHPTESYLVTRDGSLYPGTKWVHDHTCAEKEWHCNHPSAKEPPFSSPALPLTGRWRERPPAGAAQASGADWDQEPHRAGSSKPVACGAARGPGRSRYKRRVLEPKRRQTLSNCHSFISKGLFHSPAFCPQSCAQLPGPETHGHHWCAAPDSESAGRSQPVDHEGCPHHYPPLVRKTRDRKSTGLGQT